MAAVIARIALLLTATAVLAASAVWLHDARTFASAQGAALSARTPAAIERAARGFERATTLSPDTLARMGEAYALLRAGLPARAAALLEDVVRSEPRNATAWLALSFADRDRDPARSAYARARVSRLSPPVGRARR
jgi:predicted Zn-dependent protease